MYKNKAPIVPPQANEAIDFLQSSSCIFFYRWWWAFVKRIANICFIFYLCITFYTFFYLYFFRIFVFYSMLFLFIVPNGCAHAYPPPVEPLCMGFYAAIYANTLFSEVSFLSFEGKETLLFIPLSIFYIFF